MKVKYWINIICLLASQVSLAQSPSKVVSAIDAFVSSPAAETAHITLSVVDLEHRNTVVSYRPEHTAVPASALKLVTTLSAGSILGYDFRFHTDLEYDGHISPDGTLHGNLHIRGGGDPDLGAGRFAGSMTLDILLTDMVDAIQDAGISCVEGSIIVDDGIFDKHPAAPSWQWADLGNYYACGSRGLNIHENLYYLHFDRRQKQGTQPDIVLVEPEVPGLLLSNEITVAGPATGDQAYIHGGPFNFRKRVVGTIPQGTGRFTIKGSIPDPSGFFVHHLQQALAKGNISVASSLAYTGKGQHKKTLIKRYASPALSTLVKATNYESLNLHAESLFRYLGYKVYGKGSFYTGKKAILRHLNTLDIPLKGVVIKDGSGLSARNNISSATLASFLAAEAASSDPSRLLQYIPRAGYDGTVSYLFQNDPAKGHVWMKSGSMQGIQSYAGFIKAKSGKWYSFAFIVNGYTGSGSKIRKSMADLINEFYLFL